MHTNTLSLPFVPGPSPRPETSDARPWSLRWPASSSTRRARKHAGKIARRGQRVVLGTRELPYDPLALGGAPLAALRQFDGLAVAVTTRSSEILEQLDLLVELDQRHAVTVDLLIASFEPGSADLDERLRTAAALSAQGITTRLVLTGLPPGPVSESAASSVRQLFEAAKECLAFDVAASFERGAGEQAWAPLLRCLRLESGFPRSLPGRG
jgi:DNA repair photolyase